MARCEFKSGPFICIDHVLIGTTPSDEGPSSRESASLRGIVRAHMRGRCDEVEQDSGLLVAALQLAESQGPRRTRGLP